MIYYIADPHFGHANIINLCNRPFENVDEMDEIMIENWNRRVHGNDRVYVLGDMFYHCEPDRVIEILERLKGKKTLIVGNHDGSWMAKVPAKDYFEQIELAMEVWDTHICTLCHYPMLSWRKQNKTYMIYGHIHDNIEFDFWPLITARPHMLNAGVEINGYQPVTFEELICNNAAFQALIAEQENEE